MATDDFKTRLAAQLAARCKPVEVQKCDECGAGMPLGPGGGHGTADHWTHQCRKCAERWLDDWPKREAEIERWCDAQNSTAPMKARTSNGRGKRSA